MKQNKLTYLSPETETLIVQTEGKILNPSDYHQGGGGFYDDGDINDNGDF